MKIALFTGNYVHIKDGVSLTLNRLVRYLTEERGFDVRVFGPDIRPRAIEPAGTFVEVPSVPAPGRPEYRVSLFLPEVHRHDIEAFKPDLIHIATPDFLGLAALRFALRHNIPVLSSYHTHFSSYLRYYGLEALEGVLWKYLRWFYERCDLVVSPSESMNAYLTRNGLPADKVGLWTRGVETGIFSPEKRSQAFRQQCGFAPDDVVVSYISRLVWEKDPRTFIDAVNRAQQLDPKIRVLVGGDGPARAQMEAELPEAVFTGFAFGEELAVLYASSDIFVFPSDTETFGNVTLEAMSSGVPALVANAVGSKSLVVNEETGYVLPVADVQSFSWAILRLSQDNALRQRMAQQARTRALSFDWQHVMESLILSYQHVVAEHRMKA
ncbi:Glycosyltransferase involved in cell wall bisynthesis [Cyclonatronum proteinivorum]|uniref:Glycosyltransferase involved in cell wall bisynthesis n=1 Tax=Cyclonatronum proteinivorum TaxID=1457365 RepID=A0A345UMD4_9BACT|nr:glycosyltransferase family 1 protein [Cyclonatronum proteinivorum]AXJ01636.1 Glycosyltransferase involved in cell wall bisynthesis [Cyclonatronum proteinivorum]